MVFAQHGDVGDDVHGAYVCGEDDDGEWMGGGGCGGFADGFDDFFHAAFKDAVLVCYWIISISQFFQA